MRLRHAVREERGAALRWHLVATDALTRFRDDVDPTLRARAHARYGSVRMTGRDAAERAALGELWKTCVRAATLVNETPAGVQSPRYLRPRDTLLAATGEDADALVHPLLIRLSAAYLDQGIAYWPMQDRELGFYRCVRSLYGRAGGRAAAWTDALAGELAREEQADLTAGRSVLDSLDALGIAEPSWQSFITSTLLALRGWAGMMRQLEDWPERFPIHTLPGSTMEFLAVRLILDRIALGWIARRALGFAGPLHELPRELAAHPMQAAKPANPEERAYTLFQIAQVLGWMPDRLAALSAEDANAMIAELEAAGELERRKLFHLAFERRYRERVLDAHARPVPRSPRVPGLVRSARG
jgi:uncharacterized protein